MPVEAPEGTEAVNFPSLVTMSTSTVGFPRESMIWRPCGNGDVATARVRAHVDEWVSRQGDAGRAVGLNSSRVQSICMGHSGVESITNPSNSVP